MKPLKTWHIETRDIDDLQSHPRNARIVTKREKEQIKKSIAKYGLIDKPVITYDGEIIGGHQRIAALLEMGHKFVECWVPDDNDPLSEDDRDELNIRLNKNQGNWDWDKLANEWDVNMLEQWGFDCKDFEDPIPKGKNPKVTFEFERREDLDDFISYVQDSKDIPQILKMKVK